MLVYKKPSPVKNVSFLFALAVSFNPKLLKKVETCTEVPNSKMAPVYIVKQWHMAAGINTRAATFPPVPQAKNQKQIYEQLAEWVAEKQVSSVIAEGCEGTLSDSMKEAFQGWSFKDLQIEAKANPKHFSSILAHPVVMLKVTHPEAKVTCGDTLGEIKKSQAALSDARADVGYLSRLTENKDKPEKLKPFLEGAIEAYHLKKGASVDEAQRALLADLKTSLAGFRAGTHARDLSFVKQIEAVATVNDHQSLPVVLVVGGLHSGDLKPLIESKQINCIIFEPLSYQNDEEALNSRLETLTGSK